MATHAFHCTYVTANGVPCTRRVREYGHLCLQHLKKQIHHQTDHQAIESCALEGGNSLYILNGMTLRESNLMERFHTYDLRDEVNTAAMAIKPFLPLSVFHSFEDFQFHLTCILRLAGIPVYNMYKVINLLNNVDIGKFSTQQYLNYIYAHRSFVYTCMKICAKFGYISELRSFGRYYTADATLIEELKERLERQEEAHKALVTSLPNDVLSHLLVRFI